MATIDSTHPDGLYLNGEWHSATNHLEVEDLSTGEPFSRIAAATPEEALDALDAAESTERAMRETTVVERANWLNAIADGIEERKEELADAIVREAGKPIGSARGEVDAAAERFRRAVEEVRDLKGEYVEGTTGGHEGWKAIVKYEPVGTVLVISPYNYPLSTTVLKLAPAIAAGNSTILKPATKTPVSSAILADIIDEKTDIPDGGFSFVPGKASEIGDTLSGDDRINAIGMTGSSSAGKHVAKVSGMIDLHMELGGNAPAIVFPDADIDNVTSGCAAGSFKYAGQRCSAVSRVLVHEDVHDEVVDRLEAELSNWEAGDLFDPDTSVGPLISEDQADWVMELIDDAVEKGANLVAGGERDGKFITPTLIADLPHDARLVHEEQFGPVAAVTKVSSEEEAIELANGGDLGLDACVFTADYDRAMRVAEKVEAGGVRINGRPSHGLGDIPFGGVKDSGIGREGIGYTIESFVERKSIIL